MYKLIFTETYLRREKKFLKQHPELVEIYKGYQDFWNLILPTLRFDYKLSGKFKEKYSISVTMFF